MQLGLLAVETAKSNQAELGWLMALFNAAAVAAVAVSNSVRAGQVLFVLDHAQNKQ